MLFFLTLAGGCLALFAILQCIEPRRLLNGMVFTCSLGFLLLAMLALVGTLGGGIGISVVLIGIVLLLPCLLYTSDQPAHAAHTDGR